GRAVEEAAQHRQRVAPRRSRPLPGRQRTLDVANGDRFDLAVGEPRLYALAPRHVVCTRSGRAHATREGRPIALVPALEGHRPVRPHTQLSFRAELLCFAQGRYEKAALPIFTVEACAPDANLILVPIGAIADSLG